MGRTDPKIDSIAPAHVSPEEQWQGQLRRDLYPALPPSLVLPPSQSWLDRTPALHPEGAPAQFIKSPARHSALFLQDFISQLLAGPEIRGALQLVSQNITRDRRLTAVEMISQMASTGLPAGFGFNGYFISVADIWDIRHQLSLLETEYSHLDMCDQGNHSTHLPSYPAPPRKNRNDQDTKPLLILK